MKKVLIISLSGIGEHYSGPAMSMYRLLKPIKHELGNEISLNLLHANEEQHDSIDIIDRVFSSFKVNLVSEKPLLYKLKLGLFLIYSSLWLLVNAHKYDVVFTPSFNFLTLLLLNVCRLRKCKTIARVASFDSEIGSFSVNHNKLGIKERFKRALAINVDSIITISSIISDTLNQVGIQNVEKVFNSVDIKRFSPVGDSARLPSRLQFLNRTEVNLITVGAVCFRKGQHLVIQALSMLPSNVIYTIVGPCRETGYLEKIRKAAIEFGVSDRVHFLDKQTDIHKIYPYFDVFILPSYSEGMPNAMLEGMACGLVPVGTRISGNTDLINAEGSLGRFVEREPESIANEIKTLLEQTSGGLKQNKENARKHILKHHDSNELRKEFSRVLFK